MDFTLQPTLLALPRAIAALAAAAIAVRIWRRRFDTPGARELSHTLGFNCVWTLMGALELCAVALPAKTLFAQLSYIGIVGLPWALFNYAHIHTGVQTPIPRWLRPLALCWAGFTLACVFTNNYTGLFWSDVVPIEIGGRPFARFERGPLFWTNIVYGYTFTLASCVLIVRHALDLQGIYRRQRLLLLLAIVCSLFANVTYLARVGPVGPFPEIDNTPVGFAIGNAILAYNLLRWRFLDLTPVATRILFERMSGPVLVIDTHQRLVQANRAAVEVLGLPPRHIGEPLADTLAAHPALLAACLSEEAQSTVPGPDDRWWSIDSSPLATPRGFACGRLCVLHDITEMVRARRNAEHAHHAKAEFLAHVSHDLRSPLNSILVLANMLRAEQPAQEPDRRLATLQSASQSLLRLVDDLLDLSRIESGRLDLSDVPFRLGEVLDPTLDLFRATARLKGIALAGEPASARELALRGDPDRLRQILVNLIGNAVKFTDHGRVAVRTTRSAGCPRFIRIEITDTGPGLPPGTEARLFDPFFRAASAGAKEGTGLGLSIVRRLSETMGGSVSAANNPDGGATFAVELPLLDEATPDAGASPDTELPFAALRILVVDDETTERDANAELLSRHGATVDVAGSGEEALFQLEHQTFHLVLMDRQMPGMGGIEATRAIRALPVGHRNHGIGIVGLTTDLPPSARNLWHEAGARSILLKPLLPAAFTAALGDSFPRRRPTRLTLPAGCLVPERSGEN